MGTIKINGRVFGGPPAPITKLTQAEYNALPEEIRNKGIYVITDAEELVESKDAKSITYDDSHSGIGDNVQDAIDNLGLGVYEFATMLEDALTANGLRFRFETDGEGNYGYLGADGSFIPFSSGGGEAEKYKETIVATLNRANLSLTVDSTWEEITEGLKSLYPEVFNVFSNWGSSSYWKLTTSGTKSVSIHSGGMDLTVGYPSSGNYGSIVAVSPEIDVSGFKTLTANYWVGYASSGEGKGSVAVALVGAHGSRSLGNGTNDISSLTGPCTLQVSVSSSYSNNTYYNYGLHISALTFRG